MSGQPRVTFGIATYKRHQYLADAIDSCLNQTYDDLEVLVVVDGEGSPEIDAILAEREHEPRLRVVRHPENRGIAEAYNTFFREGRGELIAMIGDDDMAMPDRIERQVAVFDRHPDTAVVHGDAIVIDERGVQRGSWKCADFSQSELLHHLVRTHNSLVDTSRLVHRRVYEQVGGYDSWFTLAQDFDFWFRALQVGRFRHVGGEPVTKLRRHGENFSDESALALEIEQVERALEQVFDRVPLRELVPEIDWAVLDDPVAERRAIERLADLMEKRQLPLPGLAGRLRELANTMAEPATPARDKGRLLMTSFGFRDAGGGTTIPRLAAKELVRRGWDVLVFYAAAENNLIDGGEPPYVIREGEEDGVRLVGVHNRPVGIMDIEAPWREIDDPLVTDAFTRVVDDFQPDVAHLHNLHNLGAALLDVLSSRGVPTYFTTHNYWLACPRGYLFDEKIKVCDGPAGGLNCASCTHAASDTDYEARFEEIRSRFSRSVAACMTVSHPVREILIGQGYDAAQLDVVQQCVPVQDELWTSVGRDRAPGRVRDGSLTIGFFGSVYSQKGAHVLIKAAQLVDADVTVRIHGELPPRMRELLAPLDERGCVELYGAYAPSELPKLMRDIDVAALPSVWWDCAPLTAGECLAARVPLLAPQMGGLADVITDGVQGLAFRGGDFQQLAANITRLATEDGLLEQLQSNITAPRGFAAWIDDLESYYSGERPGLVTESPERPMTVRWVGDQLEGTSLARINREVCTDLEARDDFVVERRLRSGQSVSHLLPRTADVEVRHQWPPVWNRQGAGRLAVIQPWEFGSIPVEWLDPLENTADELWVPSEYVRSMYVGAGVDAGKVHVVPNGVDLDRFSPEGDQFPLDGIPQGARRFLFVGGFIGRKGPDVLLNAWRMAFAGRTDVALIIKDFGAEGHYKSGNRAPIADAMADPSVAPIVHLTDDLSDEQVASLFRSADVLVHPYRGEGFAMPVLEAMASGIPSIVTGGGPTDEFCPTEAGWRIKSARTERGVNFIEPFQLTGNVWDLEPDLGHFVELLREAANAPAESLKQMGAAARAASLAYSWANVAEIYAERLRALAAKVPIASAPPKAELEPDGERPRVLASPAWKSTDRLGELLAAWEHSGSEGSLVLLADPKLDGDGEALEARALRAAADQGVDLSACPDIAIRFESPYPGRDEALLAECDAYVVLHDGAPGRAALARSLGVPVVEPSLDQLAPIASAKAPAGRPA